MNRSSAATTAAASSADAFGATIVSLGRRLTMTASVPRRLPASAGRHNRSVTGFVDIHAHVLPGIDDGPGDMEQTIALLRAAADSGTSAIAATPHLRSDFPNVHVEELAERCQAVREAIDQHGLGVELVCAAEVSLVWAIEASDSDLVLASYAQRGTDMLVETPSFAVTGFDRLLYRLRAAGPERSPEFQRDRSALAELVRQGVLLQVNAESLAERLRRSSVGRLARNLCAEGLAHVIASDGHRGSEWRPVTRLAEAVDVAGAVVGAERARWMMQTAPRAIIDGAQLPPAPAPEPKPLRRWWWRG
jgi:protein-tyrosine phosphatase